MDTEKIVKFTPEISQPPVSCPYPDSRFYRKDKPQVALGNPSVEHRKYKVKVPQR